VEHLSDEAVKGKDANYLFDEIGERVSGGPVSYQIKVQLAGEGDVVDDATRHWPAERPVVPFGKLSLTSVVPEQIGEQRKIIFDPIPRLSGIEPSADPLLELRAAIYLISGRRRRQA
jgi:catalase